jgi:hypothetical protein
VRRAALVALGAVLALGACDGGGDEVPMHPVPLTQPEGAGPAMRGREMPADHPPVGNAAPAPGPAAGGGGAAPPMAAGGGGDSVMPAQRAQSPIAWTVPTAWTEQTPSSTMRVAQWGIPGAGGAGECAIFLFAGGGAVDANLDRWVGQFAQPDGSSSDDHDERAVLTVNGLNVHTIRLTGIFRGGAMMGGAPGDLPDYALFGAVVDRPGTPVFLKCTGPAATMTAAQGDLDAFVASFRED